jgi:hypothetical protein
MRTAAVYVGVGVLYALHQDFWFWREARPLIFGVMPVGLFYHAAYMVASSLMFWGLVAYFWPTHLENATDGRE